MELLAQWLPQLILAALSACLIIAFLENRQRIGISRSKPSGIFLLFLLIAVSLLWVHPVGPMYWGIALVPSLGLIFCLALFLLVVIPEFRTPLGSHSKSSKGGGGVESPRDARPTNYQLAERRDRMELNLVYWILTVVLVIALMLALLGHL